MKSVIQALWLVLLLAPCLVTAAEVRRAAVRDYARVAEWAQANGFEAHWLKREESLQISSPQAKVVITADSREVRVNGVQVWLSHTVIRQGGSLFVSQLDLKTTLRPLLVPPRNRPGQKVISVCLAPGHGGRDPGNQVGSNQEKKFTLLLAKELRDQLARAGFKTILTRSTDRYIELPDRADYANRRK